MMRTDDCVTQEDLQEIRQMQIAMFIQIGQVESSLSRLRWWRLTLAILMVCLSIVIWRLS